MFLFIYFTNMIIYKYTNININLKLILKWYLIGHVDLKTYNKYTIFFYES